MKILHFFTEKSDSDVFKNTSTFMSDKYEHFFEFVGTGDVPRGDFDVVHAHDWLKSGIAAAKVAESLKIPYVIGINERDSADFGKIIFLKRNNCFNVLHNAAKVVLTNYSQQDFLTKVLPSKMRNEIFGRSVALLNAIDSFWLDNLHIHSPTALVHIKLLYVGALDNNVADIVSAMKRLQSRNYFVSLTAVEIANQSANTANSVQKLAQKYDFVRIVQCNDRDQLLKIFRSHDVMVFTNPDTYSPAYAVAAFSQGLPVIFAKNNAFDGLIEAKSLRFSVSRGDSRGLAAKILEIGESFGTVEQHIMSCHPLVMFDGRDIARHYEHLYDNLL